MPNDVIVIEACSVDVFPYGSHAFQIGDLVSAYSPYCVPLMQSGYANTTGTPSTPPPASPQYGLAATYQAGNPADKSLLQFSSVLGAYVPLPPSFVLSGYAFVLPYTSARPVGAGPGIWTGSTAGTPPANALDGDLWVHP